MNKKLFILALIFFLLVGTFSSPVYAEKSTQRINLPCTYNTAYDNTKIKSTNKNHIKDIPRFWTEDNLKYLSDSQRQQLSSLQDKIKNGDKLTIEEKEQMWALKDIVIKAKLGDKKFNDFKHIMTKKKHGQQLTDSEISQLKSYFNEIKGE